MLKIRVLSSMVMAPPVLAAVWFGSWAFVALAALAAVILAWEWSRMCLGSFGVGGGILAAMGICVAMAGMIAPLGAVAAILVATPLAALSQRARGEAPSWFAAGAVYIGVPVLSLVWLRDVDRDVVIWLLLLVWATDIGAYFAGRSIGGPRLAPRISPNKTWAGLAGGVAAAALVGALVAIFRGLSVDPVALGALSAGLALVAQAGDLAESTVKRHFHAKDSSALIPGHGGLFDRIDGLMATAPVVACLALGDLMRMGR